MIEEKLSMLDALPNGPLPSLFIPRSGSKMAPGRVIHGLRNTEKYIKNRLL